MKERPETGAFFVLITCTGTNRNKEEEAKKSQKSTKGSGDGRQNARDICRQRSGNAIFRKPLLIFDRFSANF